MLETKRIVHVVPKLKNDSVYKFICICNKEVTSSTTEGTCPHCGRKFELHWREEE